MNANKPMGMAKARKLLESIDSGKSAVSDVGLDAATAIVREFNRAIAAKGGRSKSSKKVAAVRRNAKLAREVANRKV